LEVAGVPNVRDRSPAPLKLTDLCNGMVVFFKSIEVSRLNPAVAPAIYCYLSSRHEQ
jgi:hypothetical protein